MADIYSLSNKFRIELDAHESAVVDDLMRAYGMSYAALEKEILRLTKEIADAQAAGRPTIVPRVNSGISAEAQGGISASIESQRARLLAIQRQVIADVEVIGADASIAVQDQQRSLLLLGEDHADALIREATGDALDAPPRRPQLARLIAQVGFLPDGSPLSRLFDALPGDCAAGMTRALIEGMAFGRSPFVVAKAMQLAMGGNAARARTIARTEMLRSYREATRLSYEANSDIVTQWQWVSAKKLSSCAVCWALHGQVFDTSERLATHPNCRCSMVPKTKTFKELGIDLPETGVDLPLGTDLFDELDDHQQLAILGPGKYQAYKQGQIVLEDLVEYHEHEDWGGTRSERSLRDALRQN